MVYASRCSVCLVKEQQGRRLRERRRKGGDRERKKGREGVDDEEGSGL
jgi:hypothetical protein